MSAAKTGETEKTALSRQRAERRRAVVRTVRDLRERLTSATGTRPAFDYELTLSFARFRIGSAWALPLLIVLVAGTATLWVEVWLAVAWALVALAMHVLMLALARSFTATPPASVKTRTWIRRFSIGEFFYGLAWASLLVITATGEGTGIEVFQFSTTLIAVSVGSMLAAAIPA